MTRSNEQLKIAVTVTLVFMCAAELFQSLQNSAPLNNVLIIASVFANGFLQPSFQRSYFNLVGDRSVACFCRFVLSFRRTNRLPQRIVRSEIEERTESLSLL
jgi:hypothetical protein